MSEEVTKSQGSEPEALASTSGNDDAGEAPTGPAAETAAEGALSQEELDRMSAQLIAAIKTVYDPEIPVDIYELGLIYKIDISDQRDVTIDMTLTAPGCPVAGIMPGWVEDAVRSVPGVREVTVNVVFDPPWTPAMMSEEAKLELNIY